MSDVQETATVLDQTLAPDRTPTPDAIGASRNRMWILLAVSLGTFMTYLDNNVINVAIPTIQRDLHLTESGIEWVVSAYILSFAGLLLAGGRFADVFGRRRLFMLGLIVFTGASLAAGLSGSANLLIASRAVQGVGAAVLTPTTLAIISTTYEDPKERAGAIGLWGAVGALALALGPLLGGLLSQHASWHWIFFINVPIGAVTLALAAWAIPARVDTTEHRPLDLAGVLSSAASLVSLTYALIQGPDKGWTDPVVLGAFGLAAIVAVAFFLIERRAVDPMIDLSLFANRAFAGGTTAIMLWAFGLFGISFFTSLYLQDVLGFSASKAGATFVPMALLMAASATVSDRVARRFGAHRSVGLAMGLMGIGIVSVSLLGRHAGYLDLMPGLGIAGIGGGQIFSLTNTVIGGMPAERSGVAAGVFNASREMAGLLGITIIGVIVTAREHTQLRDGHPYLTSFLSGYRLGLVVAGVLVAAGGLIAWLALRGIDAPPAEAGGPRDRLLEVEPA
jgi:EmrB/QacA subfamily drug resistance transporter